MACENRRVIREALVLALVGGVSVGASMFLRAYLEQAQRSQQRSIIQIPRDYSMEDYFLEQHKQAVRELESESKRVLIPSNL